jgi:hypothetical protein
VVLRIFRNQPSSQLRIFRSRGLMSVLSEIPWLVLRRTG